MRLSFRRRIFSYFALILVAFSVVAIVLEQSRQTRLRERALTDQLAIYIDMIARTARPTPRPYAPGTLDSLAVLWPRPLRISILDASGTVLYDNATSIDLLENHSLRPEIQTAQHRGQGQDLRLSRSTGQEYFYLARRLDQHFIRVAMPYDDDTQSELRTDRTFTLWILAWLALMLWLMAKVSRHLGSSVRRLRRLALGDRSISAEDFPDDELGDISRQITLNYNQLQQRANELARERERLLQHVLTLTEGVCFFDAHGTALFFNAPFLQHLNSIATHRDGNPSELLTDEAFADAMRFISNGDEAHYQQPIQRHGRSYMLRISRFDDGGYTMVLDDITETEKNNLLKREMTSNIAHELRTPVTSIRGYLETCIDGQGLDAETRDRFLLGAYRQTLVLSELIRDIGLLTRLDEASELFEVECVDLRDLHAQLTEEFADLLATQRARLLWHRDAQIELRGNRTLLYAIFRNLIENALRYAGTDIEIGVSLYQTDEAFYYFSVYDTGSGVAEEHLVRIFERFYRCSHGRTRQEGGSGLGLSIVKHAVLFHGGDISAKNRAAGGLEVLFHLARR